MQMRTDRVISSIPREDSSSECPGRGESLASQCPNSGEKALHGNHHRNWLYPSPKMFWTAMNRKGTLPDHLKDPEAESTHTELDWIVTIHNVVNEQCWQEICQWERFRRDGCNSMSQTPIEVKLQRFLGRPKDTSPRAWFKTKFMGYKRPFDRHDWYVRGTDPSEPPRRYIIDFYSGSSGDSITNSFHLDVRPALDSFDSLGVRIRKYLCKNLGQFLFDQ